MSWKSTAAEFAIGSFAGWAIENAWQLPTESPRYSHIFGSRIPALPVYGFGSVLVVKLARYMRRKKVPIALRAIIYGAAATTLEYGACRIDRALGKKSWDYSNDSMADATGCVELKHAMAWGILGTIVDSVTS